MTTPEDIRAEFEKWAVINMASNHFDLKRHSKTGAYLWTHVQEAWIAWQACAAHKAELVSLEKCAKALCKYEHGGENYEKAWQDWHSNFESLAEIVLDAAEVEYV